MNQRSSLMMTARTFVCLFALLPITLWAEASVEEASASSSGGYSSMQQTADPEMPLSQENTSDSPLSSNAGSSASTFNPNNPASLLSKINEMQREIQKLRGQMEVQSYELKKLKEQQQAYYNDLDQRISMLSSGKKNPVLSLDTDTDPASIAIDTDKVPTSTPAIKTAASATATLPPSSSSDKSGASTEESSYNAAYELIQNKQFPEAALAMKTFIQQYPHGKFSPNAHYWLGELLLAQHQEQPAIKEFNTVINDYPSSNKVSASMLKLGFIYAHLGDTTKAKAEFMNIQKMFPGTTTAQLAEERLRSLPA